MRRWSPDVKFILEARVGSLLTLTEEGDPFLEDRVAQEQNVGSCESNGRLTLLKNPPGRIIPVLRLNVMFRKDTTSPKRQQLFKASGRKVVKKAVQTPQKESTTNPSIASPTSIQDSPPSSC